MIHDWTSTQNSRRIVSGLSGISPVSVLITIKSDSIVSGRVDIYTRSTIGAKRIDTSHWIVRSGDIGKTYLLNLSSNQPFSGQVSGNHTLPEHDTVSGLFGDDLEVYTFHSASGTRLEMELQIVVPEGYESMIANSVTIGGDSFTAGLFATNRGDKKNGDGYVACLYQNWLTENPDAGSVNWSTGGVVGGKLVDAGSSASNVAGVFRLADNPDITIMALGQNDTNGSSVDSTLFRQRTQFILDELQANVANVFVVAIPLQPTWQANNPTRYSKAIDFNNILKTEATMRGIPFIDAWANVLTPSDLTTVGDVSSGNADITPSPPYTADGYHPNNDGHKKLGDAIWNSLKTYVIPNQRIKIRN